MQPPRGTAIPRSERELERELLASLPLPTPRTSANRARLSDAARKSMISNPNPQSQQNLLSQSIIPQSHRSRPAVVSHMTPTPPKIPLPVKSSNTLTPLWQLEDEAYEHRSRPTKRNREDDRTSVLSRRVSMASASRRKSQAASKQSQAARASPKAYMLPGLRLKIEGDSDMDEDEPPARAMRPSRYFQISDYEKPESRFETNIRLDHSREL